MRNKIQIIILATAIVAIAGSCSKKDRPALGEYPVDANPPGGPLKFYTAFDGTTSDPLMNAVDSVRANFPASNPLESVYCVLGKPIKTAPAKDKAIRYTRANDFVNATLNLVAKCLYDLLEAGFLCLLYRRQAFFFR